MLKNLIFDRATTHYDSDLTEKLLKKCKILIQTTIPNKVYTTSRYIDQWTI